MKIALDMNNNRISAEDAVKSGEYRCPICSSKVILRQGKINVSHFAHASAECEDKWNYDMSEWHYSMQEYFDVTQREVIVRHNGQVHRADVLLGNKIIEFQHSPISYDEIAERNNFYRSAGYQIAWVFDVQDQYDSGAISCCDRDNVLMYRWKNPKRCLQCFPAPKEYSKDIVLFLYWEDEFGCKNFNRIIWTSQNCDGPDFSHFIVSKHCVVLEEDMQELEVSDFFETKEDLLIERLREVGCSYVVKQSGVKKLPQHNYICPKTKKFGLSRFGEDGCRYCKHCAALEIKQEGRFNVYCCYPKQVNSAEGAHPGYECAGVPEF